ncbi:MAG: ABC transporter substrate-binding protein, partial [Deltaproteobacteria bacterium]
MRIASLLASNTEIAFALGLGDQIVGVSHECDYPKEAKTKPVLTKSKVDPHKKSADIDEDVKNVLRLGLSVYEVDLEKLERAKPDLILTQDQCEVCAVSLKDVERALREHICDAKVISLKPMVFDDLFRDIQTIADATNREIEAEGMIRDLKRRVLNVYQKTKNLKKP